MPKSIVRVSSHIPPGGAKYFIHVGMHKTGTTFMQKAVFPKFKNITYVKPNTLLDGYLRLELNGPCLISNERLAGRLWATLEQVDASLKRLSEIFPGAVILMSFRPHESFIVSSYKQYLHQGGILRFKDYFDFTDDSGLMKREQFLFAPRVEMVRKHFGRPPFVFLQQEIRNGLPLLLSDMGRLMGITPPDPSEIISSNVNQGVTYQQARVLRWVNQFDRSEFNPEGRFRLYNFYTRILKLHPRGLVQFWLRFLPDGPFFTEEESKEISAYYAEDWRQIEEFRNARMDIL
jgi:hypothetical protein